MTMHDVVLAHFKGREDLMEEWLNSRGLSVCAYPDAATAICANLYAEPEVVINWLNQPVVTRATLLDLIAAVKKIAPSLMITVDHGKPDTVLHVVYSTGGIIWFGDLKPHGTQIMWCGRIVLPCNAQALVNYLTSH